MESLEEKRDRTEDIMKAYNFGASEEAYRVSFPLLTLPFYGRGGTDLYPPYEGRRFRCSARAVLLVFLLGAASPSLFAPSATTLPLRAFRPLGS